MKIFEAVKISKISDSGLCNIAFKHGCLKHLLPELIWKHAHIIGILRKISGMFWLCLTRLVSLKWYQPHRELCLNTACSKSAAQGFPFVVVAEHWEYLSCSCDMDIKCLNISCMGLNEICSSLVVQCYCMKCCKIESAKMGA